MDADDRRLIERLLSRASRAKARSEELVGQAESLAGDVDRVARRPVRCAWCRRVRVAGEWRSADAIPDFFKVHRDPGSVTHGICDDCMRELRATGRSH